MSSAFSPAAMNPSVWSWKLLWRGSFGLNDQSNSVTALDEAGLTAVQFVLQDQGEGLEKGLVGALRLQHARLERVADTRQAQLLQAAFDFRHGHRHVVGSPVGV